jgi:hypothetical protein
MSGDCNHISTHQVYFDHIDRVEAGVGKRYDFESPTGGLTIAASHAIITKGDAVRLSTKLTDGGLPRAGATVTLWAKKRGAARFQLVRTVAATNSNGAASATLRPKTATTYQWRHAKDAHTQATRSPTTLVQIAA